MKILGVGEILWDIFPERELLGGAALNFSAALHRLGDQVMLFTAVGRDHRGELALSKMSDLGLSTDFVQLTDAAPTGTAVVQTDKDGEPQFKIQRPAAFDEITISPEFQANLRACSPDWLYFGTLLQMKPEIEALTRNLAALFPSVRCFYDMNLRANQWELPLVQRLCSLANVLKLNKDEVITLSRASGIQQHSVSIEGFCRPWAQAFHLDAVCVTLGAAGCAIYQEGGLEYFPGYPTAVSDTVGAGDAFAAAFLYGYHRKWPMEKTARFANALGAIVAGRSGANPHWTPEELDNLAK